MLGVSYDGMSFNLFSLADWFKVIDKVSKLWRHALILWIGNLQSSVEVVTIDPATDRAHACRQTIRSQLGGSLQRSLC